MVVFSSFFSFNKIYKNWFVDHLVTICFSREVEVDKNSQPKVSPRSGNDNRSSWFCFLFWLKTATVAVSAWWTFVSSMVALFLQLEPILQPSNSFTNLKIAVMAISWQIWLLGKNFRKQSDILSILVSLRP